MRDTVLDGRYTLTERIGAGGMGVVWRARDARLERPVAVKLLSLPPGTAGAERERMLAMFGREARAAAALDSSYIVPVFDHGADGEVPYLVMPLLSGRTVGELLAGGRCRRSGSRSSRHRSAGPWRPRTGPASCTETSNRRT